MEKITIGKCTLIHSRWEDVIIEDHSIDLILIDPPYGKTNAHWDKKPDLNKMWEYIKRVLKPDGLVVSFAATPFTFELGLSNPRWYRYSWVWEKTQAGGHFNAKLRPMVAHEDILVFSPKKPRYFPQKTEGHKPVNSYTKRVDVANKSLVYGKSNRDISGGGNTDRYPRSVIKFKSDKQKNKLNGTIHASQKPIELIKYLLQTYMQDGVVLDMFAGSSTVGVAANELDLESICIEADKAEFNKSKNRLSIEL